MSSGYSLWGNDDITDRNAPVNNPITAFNFVLEVEGVYFMALKSVKVFNKENEYEYIREGGVNDYVHMRRKPISKPFTFQVERYVGTERFLDPLANGTELTLPVMLYVYRHKARSEIIDAAPAWPARIYTFTGCVVTAKEYGELNSEKSAILTETTTIAYRELMVVTNPFEEGQELEPYVFKKSDKTGNTTNKYARTDGITSNEKFYEKKKVDYAENQIWVRKDTAYADADAEKKSTATNKPFWSIKNKEGHTTKYADQRALDIDSKTYEVGEDGYRKRTDSAAKKRLDGYDIGTEVLWANGTNMNAQKHYAKDADGWRMTDKSDLQKPKQTEYKDAKPKYADSKNVKSPDNYKEVPGKDGQKYTKYIGGDERIDKPATDAFKEGDKPKWAKDTNAVSDKHYKKLPPKQGGWESTDDTAKKQQTEYKDAKPKWADATNAVSEEHYTAKPGEGGWEVSDGTDKPRWDIKENKTDPKPSSAEPARNGDTPPPVMTPWDIKANKENPKPTYAKPAENGDAKAEPKGPWSMQSNKENPKPEFAKPATNGDKKQPEKKPWDIKANKENPKVSYAKPATNGDGKQPAKEPWDIKANREDPKPTYAVPAPNGDKKQTPVTWPPTRRALMAESLNKK